MAFGMCVKFLEEHLLAEQCLKLFEFLAFDPSSESYLSQYMILDSQAIEHLELVEMGQPAQTNFQQREGS